MRDVIEQLDSYQDHLDAMYPAVTASEVFDAGTVELGTLGAPPKRAWRPVVAFGAAFVAVAAVGLSLYLVGGTDTAVTVPTLDVATTQPSTPVVPISSDDLASWEWQPVAVGESWTDSVVDLAALDDGSFVALADADGAVYWSPDGREWTNADPFGEVSPYRERSAETRLERQVMAGVRNQVVILGGANAEEFGVWIGDPQIGEWGFLPLDTSGISGTVDGLAIVSNGTEVLVVGIEWKDAPGPEDEPDFPDDLRFVAQYVTWKVNPNAGTAERHTLDDGGGVWVDSIEAAVDWFKGHWYVAIVGNSWIGGDDGWLMNEPILISPDGKTWTEITRVVETDAAGNPKGSLVSLTAGESTIIMTACNFGGDTFYVSPNAVDWAASTRDYFGHRSVYSEVLGFVVVYDTITHSLDGQTWTPIPDSEWGPATDRRPGLADSALNLAASNTSILLASDVIEPGLWIYTEP